MNLITTRKGEVGTPSVLPPSSSKEMEQNENKIVNLSSESKDTSEHENTMNVTVIAKDDGITEDANENKKSKSNGIQNFR